MSKVKRTEIFDSRFQDVSFTDEGFMRVPIRATRIGIFPYIMKDGSIRRELRSSEEVFSVDSLETLKNKIITDSHPKGMVDSKNAKKLQIGHVGEQIQVSESKFIDINGLITDEKIIKKISNKEQQQVSCGYTAFVVDKGGIWNGQEYDAIQTNIRYNHVALVDVGRAGPNVKLKLDESDGVFYTDLEDKQLKKDGNMEKIKIGEVEIEVSKENATAINKFIADQADSNKKLNDEVSNLKKDASKIDEVKSELDKATAKADSLEVKNADLEKSLKESKNDSVDIHELVKERKSIEESSLKVCSEIEKMDEMDNMTLKKHVVSKMLPNVKMDEKSEDYINASFETITGVDLKIDHLANALKKKVENDNKSSDNKSDSLSPEEMLQKKTEENYKNNK